MSISKRITGWLQRRGLLSEPDSWLVRNFGGRPVHSGVQVSEQTAMQSTAVFSCVRLISGTIASLPLPVYRNIEPRGKLRDKNHDLYKILHDRPNPEQSSYQWRQMGLAHQLLWGDWISEIEYRDNKPVALWPIPPWLVDVKRGDRGFVYYDVTLPNQQVVRLPAYKVLHIRNLMTDGLRGMSCIRAGAEAIGLSIAAEEFGARFYGEGANVGGLIEYPGKLKDDKLDEFKNSLRESYTGLGKSHRLMVLEEGTKYHRVGIPPNEAQFLELRKFQVAEIGRLFGISQLHKIGDLERATFSNIEQQNIEFVVDTIRPLLVNIEQEINYKLFNDTPHFSEFVVDGLLRGDTQTRYQAYSVARQWGWLSANDVRELENMNPLPDDQGDMYLIPMNMVPAEQAKMPDPQEPEPPEEDDRSVEKREQRNRQALHRARTAKSHERIFEEKAREVCTREKRNVMKALEKHMGERGSASFDDWLEDFYREFQPYVKDTMRPAIVGLAEVMQSMTAEEMGVDAPDVQRDIDKFIEDQGIAHTARSRAVIKQLVRRAEEENLDPVEVVGERLDDWEENRPAQIANDSTVAVGNRVAKAVFAAAGVQRLRWQAIGADTCPYCQEMDGRVVGIDEPFVARDDDLESEDGRMPINKPTLEPPLHMGCVCVVGPE